MHRTPGGRRHSRFLRSVLLLGLLAVFPAGRALAVTNVWVDDTGCSTAATCGRDNNSDGTPDTLCCSIKTAICNLTDATGGTVWVKPGTYTEVFRMRPKVNLRSEGGPLVTTINGTGQNCSNTATDYCGAGTTECGTVVAGSAVLSDTLLEGFTITGGKGIGLALDDSTKIGGGVVIFGSLQVNNNIIQNNTISGTQHQFYGGGIGVWITTGVPRPKITNNTIRGNRVTPPDIGGATITDGWGAGIMSGREVQGTIERNLIQNNIAGDPAIPQNSVTTSGRGGGIYTYGDDPTSTVIISRNVISGNKARDLGGGLVVDTYDPGNLASHTKVVVANNEIHHNTARAGAVGNTLARGGGIYTAYSTVTYSNNTIHENDADNGGGHVFGAFSPGTDAVVENNNIYSNNTTSTTTGGALYSSIGVCHTVRYTDFWQNDSPQISGDCNDTLINTNNNLSVNPFYIDSNNADGTVDLHPTLSSLVVDAGNNADIVFDLDGTARDRDLNPRLADGNNDGTVRVDMGAYEVDGDCDGDGTRNLVDTNDDNDPTPDVSDCAPCNANIYPGHAETCNTLDDNCDGTADNDADTPDGDGTYNCLDPDDDNDTRPDGTDCAPLIPSAYETPGDVGDSLRVGPGGAITWRRIIQSTVSNVYRGSFGPGLMTTYNHTCFESESPDQASSDPANPPAGTVRYYLVAGKNRCAVGTLGQSSSGVPRPVPTCSPLGVNSDGDSWTNLDDNCPMNTNLSQADLEHDGIGDLCDDDNDNDNVLDAQDCAPFDATTSGVPFEIAGVTVAGKLPSSVGWDVQPIGSSTRYDVATGLVSDAHNGNFGPGPCLQNNVITPPYSDVRGQPPTGNGYYYMIRSQNPCGTGTYGSTPRNQHGSGGGGACP